MIKFLNKLYIPEKYIVMYRYRGFENETPFMSSSLLELISKIKQYYYQPDDRYMEIELYNLDADDMIPFDVFDSIDQVLELRKHARLRRIFFSSKFNQLYGESFYINNNSFNIKIDYPYIYGKWRDRFKAGDIVLTNILADEIIPNTNNKKYGKRLKLKILFTEASVLASDMVCGLTFKIVDDKGKYTDLQAELYPSDYRPVISVSTLTKPHVKKENS